MPRPKSATLDAVRDGALYNYNMFAYLDGDFFYKAVEHLHKGGKPDELKKAGIVPDLMKRGALRSVYDGHHVFTRYFSPKQHNRPTTIEDLYKLNDVELFDVRADPLEMNNLAVGGKQHRELVVAMNEKLNRLIDTEVGEDRGQMLPGGIDAGLGSDDGDDGALASPSHLRRGGSSRRTTTPRTRLYLDASSARGRESVVPHLQVERGITDLDCRSGVLR